MGTRIKLLASQKPKPLAVSISLPASKSISNRLLIMQTLSKGLVHIENLSTADDTLILQKALQIQDGEIHLGLAGTALRFVTALAAVTPGTRILKGYDRLHERPIKPLVDALRSLGAEIEYLQKDGFAPLKIVGKKLEGKKVRIDGSLSSQFLTALLLIAPYCSAPVVLEIAENQVSLPYVDMTIKLMRAAGVKIEQEKNLLKISGAYAASHFKVEPDWSAASYFYLWALAMKNTIVEMEGLHFNSVQGDSVTADIFAHYGLMSHATKEQMRIAHKLVPDFPAEINCVACPDLAQSLAVAAVMVQKPVLLTGLQTLKYKETDRIAALQNELEKCGVTTLAGSDFLEIKSFSKPVGIPIIKTYNDHRMAMAFAPLAAVFREIYIEDPDVVSKSYPHYWKEVEKLGVVICNV